jgi:thiol-disulfide isomerase/thioredoxin
LSHFTRTLFRTIAVSFGLSSIAVAAEPVKMQLTEVPLRLALPTMRLPNAAGQVVDIAQHRGKVILLDFWATWCGGCKEELPWFADFQTSFKNMGLSVIAVSMDDSGWATVTPFVSAHRMPKTVLMDDGSSTKQFAIQAVPVALLIDRRGRVAAKYVGLVDRNNIEQNIRSLLREP